MARYNQAVQKQNIVSQSVNEDNAQNAQNFFQEFFDFWQNIFDFLASLIIILIVVYALTLIIRVTITAKKSGSGEANELIAKEFGRIFDFIKQILANIMGLIKNILQFIQRKKYYFIILALLIILWQMKVIKPIKVQSGQKAVDIESGKILNPGVHLTSPLLSQYIIVHTADYQFSIPEITAESKYPELQDVLLNVNLTFHIKENKLVDFYRKQGPTMSIWNTADQIVSPRAIEQIKTVVRDYSFKEVHLKQSEIKNRSIEEIQKVLEPLGLELDSINIVNIRISQKFIDVFGNTEILEEKKILETAELEQEQIRTKKELEVAQREKEKKIIEAQGVAEANKIISSQNITPLMLELKKIENQSKQIEKWNGQPPQNVGGDFEVGGGCSQ
ncbi:MAG: hypothetical protein GF335_04595 [Candidatus Moranbacteria bacterium]|nr:hypothetical protein [Candidatus Moranbacteria bacterium]